MNNNPLLGLQDEKCSVTLVLNFETFLNEDDAMYYAVASTQLKGKHCVEFSKDSPEIKLSYDDILECAEKVSNESTAISHFDRTEDDIFLQDINLGLVAKPSHSKKKLTSTKPTCYVQMKGKSLDDSLQITIQPGVPDSSKFTIVMEIGHSFKREVHTYDIPSNISITLLVVKSKSSRDHKVGRSMGCGERTVQDNINYLSKKTAEKKINSEYVTKNFKQGSDLTTTKYNMLSSISAEREKQIESIVESACNALSAEGETPNIFGSRDSLTKALSKFVRDMTDSAFFEAIRGYPATDRRTKSMGGTAMVPQQSSTIEMPWCGHNQNSIMGLGAMPMYPQPHQLSSPMAMTGMPIVPQLYPHQGMDGMCLAQQYPPRYPQYTQTGLNFFPINQQISQHGLTGTFMMPQHGTHYQQYSQSPMDLRLEQQHQQHHLHSKEGVEAMFMSSQQHTAEERQGEMCTPQQHHQFFYQKESSDSSDSPPANSLLQLSNESFNSEHMKEKNSGSNETLKVLGEETDSSTV